MARACMLKLSALDADMHPAASFHNRTFRVMLEARDGAVPSAAAKEVRLNLGDCSLLQEPTHGLWLPAAGAPFPTHNGSDQIAMIDAPEHGAGGAAMRLHPIHAHTSGVIDVRAA